MLMIRIQNMKWILLYTLTGCTFSYADAQQTIDNVVVTQSQNVMLQCPVSCANTAAVQWHMVDTNDQVQFITQPQDGSVYPDYRTKFSVNVTSGYCALIIIQPTMTDTVQFSRINCVDQKNGKTAKAFNIYIIGDGPRCSSNVGSSDGYATDGQTLQYTCSLTYGGGGPKPVVEMSWFSVQPVPQGTSTSSGTQVFSTYDVTAVKPFVPAYTCRSSFGDKSGSAAVVTRDCVVSQVSVKYAVTDVRLSRQGSNFVPGTNVSCSAEGFPAATIRWVDSGTRQVVVNGPVLMISQASTVMYHCEAFNSLNDPSSPISSPSIMFNSTINPDEVAVVHATPGWVVPVVVCVPLSILLLVLIVCMVWPKCPISRAIRNRRAQRLLKEEGNRRQDLDSSTPVTTLDATTLEDDHPDIVPKPRPRPRPTPNSSLDRPAQAPPTAKKPSVQIVDPNESSELLYADLTHSSGPEGSKKIRPPRPQPKPQSNTIYTPVMRS